MERKIITFAEPRKVEIRSSRMPPMDENSIRTKTTVTSISRGTELNLYNGRTRQIRGIWYAWYPLVPGYETVGRVIETGANVDYVKEGDRVVGATVAPEFEGFCSAWGGQAEYGHYSKSIVHDDDSVEPAKIPDSVSDEEAAMTVLSTVALNGIRNKLSFVGPGTTVVVLGQGAMGLAACQFLNQMGARVIVADAVEARADIARREGWAESVCGSSNELIDPIAELTNGGPDVVHDTTGSIECLHASMEMVRPGGTILGTGLYLQPITIDLCNTIWTRSLTFACCVGASPGIRSDILNMIDEGTFNAKVMVSETFDVDQADEAYRRVDAEPDKIIKPVIRW